MAMIGNQLSTHFQTPPSVVRFSGDGSDTTFALGRTVGTVQDILVSVDAFQPSLQSLIKTVVLT